MIVLAHAGWLLALPLPLIVRYLLPPYRDARSAVRVPMFDVLVDAIGGSPSSGAVVRRREFIQTSLFVLCWACVVVALARPQWVEPPVVREIATRDLMLAIDLSGSMETEDFVNQAGERVDRLAAVKEVLDDFLMRRKGDRVGMIVFGSGAFVQIPFTEDLDVCRKLLDQTAVRMAGPKTALGDAIGLSITLFQRSDLDDKVLIALTDGNDTGSRVPPVEAAGIAADNGIVIHTIGVGDPAAAGEELLDEEALEGIATTTGGGYFHANDRNELAKIYEELDQLSQRESETVSFRPKQELFHWPLALVVLSTLAFHTFMMWRSGLRQRLVSTATDGQLRDHEAAA